MTLKVEMVTFDCGDAAKLASWWADQFGGTTQELIPGEFIAVMRPQGPRLGFQNVPDRTSGKNRLHLDFAAEDVDGEVSRLTAAERPRWADTSSARTFAGWCWPTRKATPSA